MDNLQLLLLKSLYFLTGQQESYNVHKRARKAAEE